MKADALASLVVIALMLHASWGCCVTPCGSCWRPPRSTPRWRRIRRHLLEVPHVHDLHAWTVTSDLPSLSVHLVDDESCFSDGHTPQIP
jgi:cobalt-zinc-cadmium efflux system protein